MKVRRNIRMSSHSKGRLARFLTMLLATIAVLFTFATCAAAQEESAPKVELYGGYSFFHPGANVHGELPGAIAPLSSRLEANPRGFGGTVTFNFNRWLGISFDGSDHWGSGEAGILKKIDDAGFRQLLRGPKDYIPHPSFFPLR